MAHSSKKKKTRRKGKACPRGLLSVHRSGFGFVSTAEGDFFIHSNCMNGAFDGDLVELEPLPGRHDNEPRPNKRPQDKPCAKVVRVIDRANDTLIGTYEESEPIAVVVPEDPRIPHDIFIVGEEGPDVPDGAMVRVRILEFPTQSTPATGVVEEVLGTADDPSLGIEVIIGRHKLETRFCEASLEEAAAATLDAEGALAEGYVDLRDRFTFTIDPADARDFDDALSVELVEEPDGTVLTRLGVHIADVGHYVPWGSSIDLEARRRATSTYLVDRVIPMLPPALSNELCSLQLGEDRRCMTVDLFLDDRGNLVRYEPYLALMRSQARLDYDEVQAILDGEAEAAPELSERLRRGSELAKQLATLRRQAGAIDFVSVDAKMLLDEDGHPVGIDLRSKTDATEMVEQAMVLANEVVARHLADRDWPGIFRVHGQPSPDACAALVPVFQEFPWFIENLAVGLVNGDPHAFQGVLAMSAGRPEHELVSSLSLRAMQRAVYKPQNEGHYGMGLDAYCHFTSPIRRYPDLAVHRMLRAQLMGKPPYFDQEVMSLPWLAEHSSDMERVADKAERESQDLKMVEYLEDSVGEAFSAIISGVSYHGLHVRLESTAEGFVPIRTLGAEYFAFDPARYTLTGEDTGRSYRLGQRIAVVLVATDRRSRSLEFELA